MVKLLYIKCATWIQADSKRAHDKERAMHFHRWGVQPDHSASCILLCEDWRLLHPSELKETFSTENYPSTDLSRCSYRYDGHVTTLARASAWYSKWPRRGIEPDNFNGTEHYKLMDASHLCHHEHCIVHVTLEGTDTNQDRKQCHAQARWLRGEGKEIPASCQRHKPPCLMQAYYTQWGVVGATTGITLKIPPQRPLRPPYRTFVCQFPLPPGFDAINFAYTKMLPAKVTAEDDCKKPTMKCPWCRHGKGFGGVVSVWGHIRSQHKDLDDKVRLREVSRLGDLWREYQYACYPRNMKAGNKTYEMLNQLRQPNMCWEMVKGWNLGGMS
ncbi:MAG: hypothetical protein Q9193_004127 [Seirophora villosa]